MITYEKTHGTFETSEEWQSELLVGDLVKTVYGLAIVEKTGQVYSVRHLPGYRNKKERFEGCTITRGPKCAWYELNELELITKGPAHTLRDQENQ